MRKLVIKIVAALGILQAVGCGANTKAVEHAEYKCLQADLVSLQQKLAAGVSSVEGLAMSLSEGEAVCALEALSAKAGSGSAK